MGQPTEALESITEAVHVYRRLATAHPDAFLPTLAASLNTQSKMQSDIGQRAEALPSIAEAVQIRRRFAAANPDAFPPNLALSHGA